MSQDERGRLGVVLAALAANFRVQLTEALLEALRLGLEDMPQADIERACRRAIRECDFMPTAAKLRELAGRGPSSRIPYFARWKEPAALPAKAGVPEGGFRAYLRELADKKGTP